MICRVHPNTNRSGKAGPVARLQIGSSWTARAAEDAEDAKDSEDAEVQHLE
jgi:hypothetical protein